MNHTWNSTTQLLTGLLKIHGKYKKLYNSWKRCAHTWKLNHGQRLRVLNINTLAITTDMQFQTTDKQLLLINKKNNLRIITLIYLIKNNLQQKGWMCVKISIALFVQ